MEHSIEDNITDDDYHPLPGTPLQRLVASCKSDEERYLADCGDILLNRAAALLILERLGEYDEHALCLNGDICNQADVATKTGWYVIHTAMSYAKEYYND